MVPVLQIEIPRTKLGHSRDRRCYLVLPVENWSS